VRRPEPARHRLAPLFVAAVLVLCGCLAARADDGSKAQLDAIQKQLDAGRQQQQALDRQAATLADEMAKLRQQQVATAQAAQAHEAALTRLESQLATLGLEQQAKAAELARQHAQQAKVLTALLRLARNPPSGLALADGAPVDLLRGGILMSAAVPPLVERANLLAIEIKTLADLRDQIQGAEASRRVEADALAQERTRLNGLMNDKAALQSDAQKRAADQAQQVAMLAAQASDLKDLIARADAEARQREAEDRKRAADAEKARLAALGPQAPPAPPADPNRPASIRPFDAARGQMLYPASGALVSGFGAADPAGGTSKGMTFETRPGAEVVAPFDGRVVFAGPFKGYGRILIIGHGDGYHSLVAGLDRIDSVVGQWLVAGEPIGTMPAGGAKPRLYLELRQNGQPVNPLPWLATSDAKVKG
jgi:septal ring factor EnvC (AmiA/AmiB activator)